MTETMTLYPRRPPGPTLLTLPYDLRHLIYTQLFPSTAQIYIQAQPTHLHSLLPEHAHLPLALLRANRQLHAEAAAFLYNSYLFNVMGRKRDCLVHYAAFVRTLRKHAHEPAEVRVDAFSNGLHSSTMCVSVQAGRGKLRLLEERGTGVWSEIGELQREVLREDQVVGGWKAVGIGARGWTACVVSVGAALLMVVVAWLIGKGWR